MKTLNVSISFDEKRDAFSDCFSSEDVQFALNKIYKRANMNFSVAVLTELISESEKIARERLRSALKFMR